VAKPGSNRLTFTMLRMTRPDTTSSANDSAISPMTSDAVGYSRDMTHTRFASVAVLALVAITIPRPAAADVRITGFGGVSFIDDSSKGTYGAAIALGGLFGFEFEAARTSLGQLAEIDFANLDVDANLTTYMFNAVVRLPAGPIQPYATAGLGAVKVTGSIGVPFAAGLDAHAQNIGWNFGGGLYIVPLPFFAIRGDVRRFQTGGVEWDDIAGIGDLPLPEFSYWRATAGVTVKF
jgi:opacity protein-like surface antigen